MCMNIAHLSQKTVSYFFESLDNKEQDNNKLLIKFLF